MKLRRVVLFCFIILFILGICRNKDIVFETFTEASVQCCRGLLPVLFPYMVISRILIAQDMFSAAPVFRPLCRLLRLSSSAMPVFWLGNLCGFPVGAQLTGMLRKDGSISREEAGRLCALSGNVSPAFVIQIVGGMLWKDVRFGVFLFVVQFLSCCLYGIYLGRRTKEAMVDSGERNMGQTEAFGISFCRAVTESAAGCLSLCGYVVFFSVLLAVLPFSGFGRVIMACVFEFTAGVEEARMIGGMGGLFLTGFAVGFGGVCVLAQVLFGLGGEEVSLRPYLIGKIFQGAVCGLAAVGWGMCFTILYKGEAVLSTLEWYDGITDSMDGWVFPAVILLLSGIHYLLCFRRNSVKSDNSSGNGR